MTWPIENLEAALEGLDYHSGRVSNADAVRQHTTCVEVLRRLASQPGLILADEVGMGKTFVALGAAFIAACADRGRNPAVIMVPPSLAQKWPQDGRYFLDHCMPAAAGKLKPDSAPNALTFLRLLARPTSTRPHVIFLNHGAFHLSHIDHWTKLALIGRAMHGRHLGARRSAFPNFAADILRVKATLNDPELYRRLIERPYADWKLTINRFYEHDSSRQIDDDPVPQSVASVLEKGELDLTHLWEALEALPARESINIDDRLKRTRDALAEGLRSLWPQVLRQARFRSPLLILDEAHHVKNAETRLASLFSAESAETVETLTGALNGRFERMLFLTATPFQLGHTELVNVLRRFEAIAWKGFPSEAPQKYEGQLAELGSALDRAQRAAADFDRRWQRLPAEHGPTAIDDSSMDAWWGEVRADASKDTQPIALAEINRAYEATASAMKQSERLLRPWVIRHRRLETLGDLPIPRRVRRIGRSVVPGEENAQEGLSVEAEQLLPFLLAARAQSVADCLFRPK